MAKILIGTSGWSYDDWKDVVYPPDAGSRFDRLVYLSELCDTIEVNSSFYHIPNRQPVASWLSRVTKLKDFQFTAKLYQGLTHQRDERTFQALIDEYLRAFEPMFSSGRLGAVLLQFPWSFKYGQESMVWLERLAKALGPMPLAVEVRHTSWLNEEYYDFLRSTKIAFCNIDQPRLASNIPPTDIVTAPLSYVRFHGRNAENWFKENEDSSDRYKYLYALDELEDWVDRIHRMAQQADRIYVLMNNHVGGRGRANALERKSMVAGKKAVAPPQLIANFPELKTFADAKPFEAAAASRRGRKPSPPAEEQGLLF